MHTRRRSCFFQLFSWFYLVLDPTEVDWESRGRKLGVPVKNLRTVRVLYWVSISESSGASVADCPIKEPVNGRCFIVSSNEVEKAVGNEDSWCRKK